MPETRVTKEYVQDGKGRLLKTEEHSYQVSDEELAQERTEVTARRIVEKLSTLTDAEQDTILTNLLRLR